MAYAAVEAEKRKQESNKWMMDLTVALYTRRAVPIKSDILKDSGLERRESGQS